MADSNFNQFAIGEAHDYADDDEEIQHEWGRYHRIKPSNPALKPPSHKISRLFEVYMKSVKEEKIRKEQLESLEEANAEMQENISNMMQKAKKFEDFKNFLAKRLADSEYHEGTADEWKNNEDGIMGMIEAGLGVDDEEESESASGGDSNEGNESLSDDNDGTTTTPYYSKGHYELLSHLNNYCNKYTNELSQKLLLAMKKEKGIHD